MSLTNSVMFHLLELLYSYCIVVVNSVLSQQKCRVKSRSLEYFVFFRTCQFLEAFAWCD